jgi:CheY-like chemotaxis protein
MAPLSNLPLDRWRAAEAAADRADRVNFSGATAFMNGTGPAPGDAHWEGAATLRRHASKLFKAAMLVEPLFARWFESGARAPATELAFADSASGSRNDTPDSADQPGHRSGHGADSLHAHIRNDARRRTDPASRNRNGVERAKHRILVVDDNRAMRYATARGLRAAGFATIEAGAGAEGLALAKAASAVVLDIHLPDIDGFEVCRLVRADPATALLPVVHVSAVFVEKEDQDTSRKAGADAYLVGPVTATTLAALVDQLISASDAEGSFVPPPGD